MHSTAIGSAEQVDRRESIYVFELPVRVWHVTHALSVIALCITGYLIANPLASVGGEASESFLMGNLRMVHLISAYVFTVGFGVRVYWAIVGNKYSRDIFYLPLWRRAWWRELFEELGFYLFLRKQAPLTVSHNALAQTAMFFFNFLLAVFMIGTGFAMHSEALGLGSWADNWFGWIIPLLGGSQNTKMLHDLGMWLFVVFMLIHIYMAVRARYMGRQTSLRSIVTGWRRYKG